MIPGLVSLLNKTLGSAGGFSAVASPPSVTRSGRGTITTPSTTAMPMGGSAPYTYAWAQVTGDSSIVINSPALDTTTFTTNVDVGDSIVGTFACTVTDSGAHTAITNQVTVRLRYA